MREEFEDIVCSSLPLWKFMFVVVIILFTLLGMSVPFLERGSSSYYISLFTVVLLVPLLLVSVYVLWHCSRKNRTQSGNGKPSETE